MNDPAPIPLMQRGLWKYM